MSIRHAQVTPMAPQLSLPLLEGEPLPSDPQADPFLTPQHLWTSLPLTTRMQVRHTSLRIIQEVLDDCAQSGQDHCSAP